MRNITKFEAEVITDMHPLFKSLLWVSIARSKDEERFILQHLHVERSGIDYHVVATDGKRMHVGTFDPGMFDDDISEIEPGEYEVIARNAKKIVLARADEAGTYPNWKALMPTDLPVKREVVTRATISRLGIRSGVLLATDFVLEACGFGNGFGKDDSVHVEFGSESPGGPFLIKHELGKAIVMPIRMDSDSTESEAEATPEIDGLAPTKTKPTAAGENVMIPDEDEDGPRIVDADPVESDLDDYEIQNLLIDLEKGPKLRRRMNLNALIEQHGPDLIHKLVGYSDWNEPDKHLLKIIQDKAQSLAVIDKLAKDQESQPEGAEADY